MMPLKTCSVLIFVSALSCMVESQVTGDTPLAKLILLSEIEVANKSYSPVVFWHGMGGTAMDSNNIERLGLEKTYPGMQVFSVQIGNSAREDLIASYFANMDQQVQQVCEQILSNKQIKKAGRFNAIGFSQGAQFLRAIVQRCPLADNGVKINNLISLGGQHQGVFGLPNCKTPFLCEFIRYELTKGAYEQDIQDFIVQAQYWHDPLHEQEYKNKNIFLANINNERFQNTTYKNRLLQLKNFVLVKFEQDRTVVPRESSHFEFYAPNQDKKILPLSSSKIWTEDRLGLKQMSQENRLKFISVPGHHLQYPMSWFLSEIAEKYLNN